MQETTIEEIKSKVSIILFFDKTQFNKINKLNLSSNFFTLSKNIKHYLLKCSVL